MGVAGDFHALVLTTLSMHNLSPAVMLKLWWLERECSDTNHILIVSQDMWVQIAAKKGRHSTSQVITGVLPVTYTAGPYESDHSGE